MSLRGTLGDFGIADIFQLIGHQAKTGILLLKDREVEVRIYFVEGSVVKAEQGLRAKADLLGNIMVRAGALSQAQLDEALATQQRTLRRLGDILVDMAVVDRQTLKDFARLQTTECIYRLFQWRAGTYEFAAQTVDYDEASYEPIRSENILMEGFRMMDEWPAVRKVIPSSACTFEVRAQLPAAPAAGADEDDDLLAGMKAAFGDTESDPQAQPAPSRIGLVERQVFSMVAPGRTVKDIIDISRLGEFETTKSLAALVGGGFLAVVVPAEAPAPRKVSPGKVLAALRQIVVRVLGFAGVAVVVGGLVRVASTAEGGLLVEDQLVSRRDALVDQQGEVGREHLRAALLVYRMQTGAYPEKLEALVEAGLIPESRLRFPYETQYGYVRQADGTVELALPLR